MDQHAAPIRRDCARALGDRR